MKFDVKFIDYSVDTVEILHQYVCKMPYNLITFVITLVFSTNGMR